MTAPATLIIPLSGDPITNGHKHVIEETTKRYPDAKKIVALGRNSDKNALFSHEEKIDMIKHMLSDMQDDTISIEFYE